MTEEHAITMVRRLLEKLRKPSHIIDVFDTDPAQINKYNEMHPEQTHTWIIVVSDGNNDDDPLIIFDMA